MVCGLCFCWLGLAFVLSKNVSPCFVFLYTSTTIFTSNFAAAIINFFCASRAAPN